MGYCNGVRYSTFWNTRWIADSEQVMRSPIVYKALCLLPACALLINSMYTMNVLTYGADNPSQRFKCFAAFAIQNFVYKPPALITSTTYSHQGCYSIAASLI
jgi:hypothetical protein